MRYWIFPGKVSRIIDGDSIEVDLDLGFGLQKGSTDIRLLGINTPEIRGSEKELGKIAKTKVEELIPVGTDVMVHSVKLDSFGRVLGYVWIKDKYDESVSEILVKEGYALAWDGTGKRPGFDLNSEYPLKT
jgi:micrococcal nuclease